MKALAWLVTFASVCALAYVVGTLTGCASSPKPAPAGYRVISERTYYPRTSYEIRSSTIGAPSPVPAPLPPPKADGGREYFPRTTYERGELTTCDFLAPCSWSASCCFALRAKRGAP